MKRGHHWFRRNVGGTIGGWLVYCLGCGLVAGCIGSDKPCRGRDE